MKLLTLAKDLKLPIDAITQTFLIVGKRGSGKSNTAARLVEQFHEARLPFVVLDPVDTWWGLKAGRDGGRGLDVYVFGGRKADLPLEAHSGTLLAEVLCEHRASMVLSLKHLSGRERSTFVRDFTRTLFQRWAGGPLHVVLEEAHEFAPQNAQNAKDGEQEMLGAIKRLWKLARSSGIGGSAVTQRPASLSKDITTQSEILVAHRTIGPQDVKAIGEWVKYHGEHLELLAELPSLPTGEAFVWAPEFPEGKPIGLTRTAIFLRDTYDSASTPKVGEQRIEPKELAPVDLERLRTKMAATIEKAKADDPRELKKQVADLKKQVEIIQASSIYTGPHKSDLPILTDADRALLADLAKAIRERTRMALEVIAVAETRTHNLVEKAVGEYLNAVRNVAIEVSANAATTLERVGLQKILGKLEGVASAMPGRGSAPAPPAVQPRASYAPERTRPAARGETAPTPVIATSDGEVRLNRLAERRVLQVLGQFGPRTLRQLAIQTGYAGSGGGFRGALSKLRTLGLIAGNGAGLEITAAGKAAIGDVDPLPTGSALVAHWMQQFNRLAEREVLRVIIEAHPKALSLEDIAARTNPPYESSGGGFRGAVGKLRTLGLAEGKGELKASDVLFD